MKRSSNIGINGLAQSLKKIFTERKKSGEDNFVKKTYEGTDDNFFEATNSTLRAALNLDKKSESYEKDLKRFGTRIKLIDVADDAIPKKRLKEILPLKKPINTKCFKGDYKKDLKRFGTRPGVIDVANDECIKKKPVPFPTDFSKAVYQQIMNKWKIGETTPFSANPFSDIYRGFPKIQITVRNKSEEEKTVVLWGANQDVSVSQPSPGDVQDHAITEQITVPTGVHPQGMVVNPANQLLYIANQLSGTITVLDANNNIVKIIPLEPSFPGFTSPVALAVNSKSTSSKYGFVYAACSVANTVAVINLSLNVVEYIPVGVRPVGVAFNPVNLRVYVANLVSNNVSVINAETFGVVSEPLPTGNDPMGLGINPTNGDIYITNTLGNSITVYNSNDVLITTIPGIEQYPVSVTYNPANNSMYAIAADNNKVYQIGTLTHTVIATITAGNKPSNSFFNSYNNYLYVVNQGNNTLTVIRPDNSKIEGLTFGLQSIGGGIFNQFNNSIYVSNTSNNTINVIGYSNITNSIMINPEYAEAIEDFKNSPAIIQHTKFVITGQERINSFRINNFTPTGNIKSRPLSFELYASPQSKLNVSEVTELAGTVIDGKMNWRFKLPGLHTVTIIIWFRQFEVREILSPSNHKSIIKNQKP